MSSKPSSAPASRSAASTAMWGGRFAAGPDAIFRAINDSLPVDWRLVRQDIAGSIAWAEGLERARVLSADEREQIVEGLSAIAVDASRLPGPPVESGAEDVHTWVEQTLTERIGLLGKKLHTGRSRNDQVATDLRLWTIEAISDRLEEIRLVREALIGLADRSADIPMPAYTHLQVAQPVTAGHWALAYEAMLRRDAGRLLEAANRASASPLGAAALAGTTYAVDRHRIAERLGFQAVCENSLDAVSDRDFVLETLSGIAMAGVHLSRIAEDLIIYASTEFGFVDLDDSVCSGSSLMPQKKNPDGLELLRGKAGRLLAEFTALSVTVKGLPLAYNKDLQEDKRPLFTAMDEFSLCLQLLARNIEGTVFRRDRCAEAAMAGGSNATELADYLVSKGVPFREAHEIVGVAVRKAIELGVGLEQMTPAQLSAVDSRIGDDVGPWLTLESMLERRNEFGGTAVPRVRQAIIAARGALATPAMPILPPLVRDPASAAS